MAILSRAQAIEQVRVWKSAGRKVVFTNGCFDLLHRGHVEYLKEASDLGDYLIVGLNSDQSVYRLKGEGRPIQSQADRAVILNALSVVDLVVIFEEDTPQDLIRELEPDILVKGGDYALNTVVGAKDVIASGGIVQILPFKEGFSTTEILTKIHSTVKG